MLSIMMWQQTQVTVQSSQTTAPQILPVSGSTESTPRESSFQLRGISSQTAGQSSWVMARITGNHPSRT